MKKCSGSRDVKGENRVMTKGLLLQTAKPSFILVNKFLNEFLDVINIGSQICQSKNSNLANALLVINECREEIISLSASYDIRKIDHNLDFLSRQYALDRHPQRQRLEVQNLEEFIVDSPTPITHGEESAHDLRRVFVELKDCLLTELDDRFTESNTLLWSSMGGLPPSNPEFCDPTF